MQLTLDTPGYLKQCFTPTQRATKSERERESVIEIELEIEDKLDKIDELQKEIKDDEEALERCLEDELDLDPEPGEEVIFDCSGPSLEEDLSWTRAEHEPEIRLLELQVGELKAKLEHLKRGGK